MSYTKISSSESQERHEENLEKQQNPSHQLKSYRQTRSLCILVWLFSLICTYATTRWYYQVLPSRCHPDSYNLPYDSNSPVHNDIKIHHDWVTRNGTLWEKEGTNPYRGPPSPQIDAVWSSLNKPNLILISEEEMQQNGFSTKGAVRWPDDPTGKTYIAQLDIFHLIHCVNKLREGNWFDYYQNNKTLHPVYYTHQTHCFDVIRQELMCTGSLNLYRLVWQETQKQPWPDFNVRRQCRRWEDIVRWQEAHQMSDEDMARLHDIRRPEGDYEWPMPPEGKKIVEKTDKWLERFGAKSW